MAEQVLMLALSPTMEEGTIVRWHKKEGETISQSEIICEVETDKATMEYESVNEGTLLKILVPDGGRAKVGDPIAVVGEPGEEISALTARAEPAEEAASETAASGGQRTEGQTAGQPEGQIAGKQDAGRQAGAAPAGTSAPAGTPAAAAGAGRTPGPSPPGDGRLKASPLARKMALENNLDIRGLSGSGPAGRIVKRDVEKALRGGAPMGTAAKKPAGAPLTAAPPAAGPAAAGAYAAAAGGPAATSTAVSAEASGPGAVGLSSGAAWTGREERIPLSGKRKVIAQRLAESKFSAPHYYLRIDVDAEALIQARERLNARLAGDPAGKVSPNAFLIKFAAEALKRHPEVNSSWQGDAILRYGSLDIGLAVAQEDGLITPVVRNCEAKGIVRIDRELKVLIDKARRNRLTPEEYTGATFTVSSLGSSGILEFTAIINPPGSAILAVGRIHKVPVVGENDQVVIRNQMILTLSCDHRVIDGVVGAAFLADLKRYLENPVEILY
jgi:pyruvate dehydrogenase E2 component (dihydrolipoamide acetyltransferase)